jgi:tRNA pseudouridine55 synthase
MYSALKLEGQPLYRLARKGISVERQPRTVTVHDLTLQRCQLPWLDIFVSCSPGTYVRSMAHDLGELLGCGAHLTALRRMRSGIFVLADALSLERMDSLSQLGSLPLVTIAEALDHLPAITLGADSARRVRNGVRPVVTTDDAAALGAVPPGSPLVLLGPVGPVAVAQVPAAGFSAGETLGLLRVFS